MPWAAAVAGPRLPGWIVLATARSAYLKEDGRGTSFVTVCESVGAYVAFANGRSKEHCRARRRGTPVRIVGVAGSNDQYGTVTPVVEVRSEEGTWSGVVDATLLRPIVPPHTILETRWIGDYAPGMWRTKDADNVYEIANAKFPNPTDWLAPHTLVEVIRQSKYARDADLYVRGIEGRHRGQSGWMIQLFIPHTDYAADDFVFDVGSSLPSAATAAPR
jgi:hypothetical protein